ncbi:MAG: hypothetical protein ABIC40_04690 [bacterium]
MSKIISVITLAVVFLTASLFLCGCGRGDNNPPTVPGNVPKDSAITSGVESSNQEGGHYLWGYYLVKIDPASLEYEVVPYRDMAMHMNVVKFLEQGPCVNCVKIVDTYISDWITADIDIKHPFSTPALTGFDVRGIAIFKGNKIFPASYLRMSDMALGNKELVNADGYTTLYNFTTVCHAPIEGYLKGKFATNFVPNSTLNGFKWFSSYDPDNNTRNAFYAGHGCSAHYIINKPAPLIFGYAVDVSWAPPKTKPVTDPMTDFGPEANCPEPWKIEMTDFGPGLCESGGTTELLVNVYDRGGPDSHKPPVVECPEIFDGTSVGVFKSAQEDYSVWRVPIANTKLAAEGDYRCLISVEDKENDPVGKWWLDLTGYQVIPVHVHKNPSPHGSLLWAKRTGGQNIDDGYDIAALSDDSIVLTGDFIGSVAFGEGEPNETVLTASGGNDIFIAKYNSDGMLVWAKRAGGVDGDGGYGIDALSDDSIVVTGTIGYKTGGSAVFGEGEPNETVLACKGDNDFFIARYDADGTLTWAKSAGGKNDDWGRAVAALSNNSIIVIGDFEESIVFGEGEPNEIELVSEDSQNIFIARYNPDGTLAWAKKTGGTNCYGIAALSDNSTVVTGNFSYSTIFGKGESNETELTGGGIFLARYKPYGALEWAKSVDGNYGDEGTAVASLSDDSIAVTGNFTGVAVFGPGESNQTELTAVDDYGYDDDVFIARYNPDGTLAWAKRAGGEDSDQGWGISALSDDSILVTGRFCDTAKFGQGEPNQTNLTSVGGADIFIAKYYPNGAPAWAKRAGGESSDKGSAIASLSDDSVVVTGMFWETAIFGPTEPNGVLLTSAGKCDIFIARFMP